MAAVLMRPFAALAAVAALTVAWSLEAEAKRLRHEADYQRDWCKGITEQRLQDGTRVDCLLEDYAIEFDFADKWAEAHGQAIHYALLTRRMPAVVLIVEHPKDCRYVSRLREDAAQTHVLVPGMGPQHVQVWTTGPAAVACEGESE